MTAPDTIPRKVLKSYFRQKTHFGPGNLYSTPTSLHFAKLPREKMSQYCNEKQTIAKVSINLSNSQADQISQLNLVK